jgi:hypothetical protein
LTIWLKTVPLTTLVDAGFQLMKPMARTPVPEPGEKSPVQLLKLATATPDEVQALAVPPFTTRREQPGTVDQAVITALMSSTTPGGAPSGSIK